jgi:hypothetical protein
MLLLVKATKESAMKKQTEIGSKKDRYSNVDRDEATLGVSGNRKNNPGLSNEDQPAWAPPEGHPEPRPVEPILNSNSNPNT